MLSDNPTYSAGIALAADALNAVARPQSLADEAHRQLLLQIEMGLWKVGAKLPPEKALAESLAVSRAVLREALSRLKADGLIETRQGSGAFVTDRSKRSAFRFYGGMVIASGGVASTAVDAAEAVDVAEREMLELRQIVESGAAELAATRRTGDDLVGIRTAVEAMDVALAARRDGSTVDDDFHNAIAAATHNAQLTKFLEFLSAQFSASRKATWDNAGYGVGITEVGQADHRAMLKAIEAGDGAKAKRLAHNHVQRAIDRVAERVAARTQEARSA